MKGAGARRPVADILNQLVVYGSRGQAARATGTVVILDEAEMDRGTDARVDDA